MEFRRTKTQWIRLGSFSDIQAYLNFPDLNGGFKIHLGSDRTTRPRNQVNLRTTVLDRIKVGSEIRDFKGTTIINTCFKDFVSLQRRTHVLMCLIISKII